MIITTLGRLTFRHENGLSYNALGQFRLPVQVMLLSSSMMLCMSLVDSPWTKPIWMIWLPFSCRVSDLALKVYIMLFRCEMQRSDGLNLTTRGQIHIEGHVIPWLLTGRVSFYLEDGQKVHRRMRFPLFTFLTQVCTFFLSFHLDSLQD